MESIENDNIGPSSQPFLQSPVTSSEEFSNDMLQEIPKQNSLGDNNEGLILINIKNGERIDPLGDENTNVLLDDETKKNKEELRALLKSWELTELLEYFVEQKIFVNILKIIKACDVEKIVRTFPLGTQILFKDCLEKWREYIGCSFTSSESIESLKYSNILSLDNISRCSTPSSPTFSDITGIDGANEDGVSLNKIINWSSKGQLLIDFYEIYEKFEEEQRMNLINMVASYFIDNKKHLCLSTSHAIEKQIIERFPTEKMEYYRNSKRGRIYVKYCNLRSVLNRSFKNSPTSSKKSKSNSNSTKGRKLFVPEQNAEECIKILKFDNLTAEEFDSYWMACSKHRLNHIQNADSTTEILKEWPNYKKPLGHRLINMDFQTMFGTTYSLLDNFEHHFPHILDFLCMENNVKERETKKLLKSLSSKSDLSEDSKNAILLTSMHGYFVPTQRLVVKDKTGMKSCLKFTIKDSQEAFLYIGKSPQEIEDHLLHLQQRSGAIQPFIIAVGESIEELNEFYVFFDGIKFHFKSLIRAVDICFKIFHLFNLHYPIACASVWGFIQICFYKIPLNPLCPKVQILLDYILSKQKSVNNTK